MIVGNNQQQIETPPHSGLWVIDLEGDNDPFMLVKLDDVFSVGQPIDFDSRILTYSLTWVVNDSAILVSMTNSDGEYLSNLIYITIEPEPKIIPLLDFSSSYLTEMADIDQNTGYSWEFLNPIYAVVLQDSTTVISYHRSFTDSAFALISLPISDETSPNIFYTMQLEPSRPQGNGRATISNNGFVLMDGVLIELEQ